MKQAAFSLVLFSLSKIRALVCAIRYRLRACTRAVLPVAIQFGIFPCTLTITLRLASRRKEANMGKRRKRDRETDRDRDRKKAWKLRGRISANEITAENYGKERTRARLQLGGMRRANYEHRHKSDHYSL